MTGLVHSRDAVHSWTFDIFTLSSADLAALATSLLHWAGVDAYLGLSTAQVHAFVVSVQAEYRDVAFHNFRHGVCVMHVTYLILHGLGLHTETDAAAVHIDMQHRAALLLAALCHDARHDGRNNLFHIASRSPVHRHFGTDAPLEQLHAATTAELMDAAQLLAHLPAADQAAMTASIRGLVLATDMNRHDDVLAAVRAAPADVDAVAQLILHCADISNPIMTTDLCRRWAACLMDEFAVQVAAERRLGLPVSTFMTAAPNSRDEAQLHIGFIERFSADAWHTLVSALDTNATCTDLFATCLSNLAANETYWRLKADRWTPPTSAGRHTGAVVLPTKRCVESLQAA